MASLSGRLTHIGLLRFSGPDAATFLQGQLTNDTRGLGAGRALLAAQTSPQGRVLALLTLLPHSSGIIAILPRELVAPSAARLGKYLLRAKARIEILEEPWSVAGEHGEERLRAAGVPIPTAPDGYVEADGLAIGRVLGDPGRFWILAQSGRLAELGLAGEPADEARREHDWRLADVRAGLAQVYAITCELFVPQMLNLDRLGAISFTKGCYTGQEIVARTQHLGRIKRRLLRVALPQGVPADAARLGGPIRLIDGRSGRLTEAQPVDEGFEGLAVVALEPAEAATDDEAPLARELPLPYALGAPA